MSRLPSLLLLVALLCAAVSLGAQTAVPWSTGTYLYDGANNIRQIGSDQFRYDRVGRLVTGAAAGHTQSVTYDAYGNIRTMTTDGTTLTFGVNGATNRLTEAGSNISGTYDGAGRLLTTSGGNSFVYDGNDTVKRSTVEGTTKVHLYSVNDERIASITVDLWGGEVRSDWTLRDHLYRVVRRLEKNGPTWVWKEDYVYRGGSLLAAETENAQTLHFHLDHLGTPRLITGSGGMKVSEHAYLPFGAEATAASQDNEKLKFTGHERDAGSLDYMHARYYAPNWGRFQSVDPGKDWDITKSQSWNLYTYTRNNPINLLDPTGRAVFANAKKLTEAGEDVMSRDHLKPVERANGSLETYCNFGVREILQEGGDHTLDGKTAAKMTEFLSDSKNATELTYQEAVDYAKQGATVIMAESGHVAVVAPKDTEAAGKKWDNKEVPFVFNVGKKNETLQLNYAFNAKKQPKAYILNKDKQIVDERLKHRDTDKKK